MYRILILRGGLATLMITAMGCATSQTVHWKEDMATAVSRLETVSVGKKATIETLEGAVFWGWNALIAEDTVRWTRTRDGVPQQLPLDEVARIEVTTATHTGKGAGIGVLAGGGGGMLFGGLLCLVADCRSQGTGNIIVYTGFLGAAGGVIIGALIGATEADKVVFVPQK